MYDVKPTVGNTKWFTHDRFGMFIHWGLYAMPARHEWVKQIEKMTNEQYEKYFKHFDPDLYDPELWADLAWNAGMRYFVVTTKHHEGFCLWDSALTDYKSTNTPYGKDLLKPMVKAFKGRGMKTGFYHSLIDWHHPDFTVDDIHPLREKPDRDKLNEGKDLTRYTEYLHGQVRELLTGFGKIDIMWFDFSYPNVKGGKGRDEWQSEKLLKMIRELMPEVILDDRLDLPGSGDIVTPEQYQPFGWMTVDGQKVVWEACQTFSGSWGYHRDETSWKSVKQLITMLIDTVGKGGNLLLNVGPTGRGEFDYRAVERLKGIGSWMRTNNRSIYGCTQTPFDIKVSDGALTTYNPDTNRLYVHLVNYPFMGYFSIEGLKSEQVEYAQFLHDASEVILGKLPAGGEGLDKKVFRIPILKPNVEIPVVEIFLK